MARGTSGRAALEIHEGDALFDVMVARSLAPVALRGARSADVAGQCHTLAWGCLPRPGTDLAATFSRGRIRTLTHVAGASVVAGWFWFSLVAGRFDRLVVTHDGDARYATRVSRVR